MKQLQDLAREKSFYTKSSQRPIRITFTRFRSYQTGDNEHIFKLDARCSTYRGFGILYLEVRGTLEERGSKCGTDLQVGFGVPTSFSEWLFTAAWHLVIILTGATLILSASDAQMAGKILRYGFLPVVYGIYYLRLRYLYKQVRKEIPDIISSWCKP